MNESNLKKKFLASNPDGKIITIWRGRDKKCTGLCTLQNDTFYVLNNDDHWNGSCAENLFGYRYSWYVCYNDDDPGDMDIDGFEIEPIQCQDAFSSTMQFLSEKKFEL